MSTGATTPVPNMRFWLAPGRDATRSHELLTSFTMREYAVIRLGTFPGTDVDSVFGNFIDGGASQAALVTNFVNYVIDEVDAGRSVAIDITSVMQQSLQTDAVSMGFPTQPTVASLLADFIAGEISTSSELARVGGVFVDIVDALNAEGSQYLAAVLFIWGDIEYIGGTQSQTLFAAATDDPTALAIITATAADKSCTNQQAFDYLMYRAIRRGFLTLTDVFGSMTRFRWFDASSANPAHAYYYGIPTDTTASHQGYTGTGPTVPAQMTSDLDERNVGEPFLCLFFGPTVDNGSGAGVGVATAAETGTLLNIARNSGINDVMIFTASPSDLDSLAPYITGAAEDRSRKLFPLKIGSGLMILSTGGTDVDGVST